MTDPSVPQSPKSRRSKAREPQTIDLPATVIDDGPKAVEPEKPTSPDNAAKKDGPAEAAAKSAGTSPKQEKMSAPKSDEPPPVKKSPSVSKATVTGLIFGLVGGVAGAALMLTLRPPQAVLPPEIENRLAAVETMTKQAQPGSEATLSPRLESVETAIRNAAEKLQTFEADQQVLKDNAQSLTGKIDALAQSALQIGSEAAAISPEVEQRITALDQRLTKELEDAGAAISANAARLKEESGNLAPLGERLEALESQVAAEAKEKVNPLPAVQYALTARLEQAVSSGKPFAGTLSALRKTGATEAELADIAVFASTGAPTAAQMKARFSEPAQAMIGYERSQSGEGITDKLLRMSERVVRIRPRENPEANDLSSMVVRIEGALDRGSFRQAADLWNTLPDAAKQLSADWGKSVNDRANAANALAKLGDKAISALEGSVK